eukprot:2231979-Rhodomonas_salina.3
MHAQIARSAPELPEIVFFERQTHQVSRSLRVPQPRESDLMRVDDVREAVALGHDAGVEHREVVGRQPVELPALQLDPERLRAVHELDDVELAL